MKGIFFSVLIAFTSLPFVGYGQWTQIEVDSQFAVSVACLGNTIFVGTSDNGIYKSLDNGQNWTPCSNGIGGGLSNRSLFVDGNVVYAGMFQGLYKSVDEGATWNEVSSGDPLTNVVQMKRVGNNLFAILEFERLVRSSNNGVNWSTLINGLPDYGVTSIASIGSTLFAGTEYDGFLKSVNNGASWSNIGDGLPSDGFPHCTNVDSTLFISEGTFFYRSNDLGFTWDTLSNESMAIAIGVAPAFSIENYLFAYYDGQFSSSVDFGNSWTSLDDGFFFGSGSFFAHNQTLLFYGSEQGLWSRPLSQIAPGEMGCSADFVLQPDSVPLNYTIVSFAVGDLPINYSWDWGDGTIDTIAYPSHIYENSGTFDICLTISDLLGCSDTHCSSLTCKMADLMAFVQVVPQVGVGIIAPEKKVEFYVFPNPTSNEVIIQSRGQFEYEAFISVYNISGQFVLSRETTDEELRQGARVNLNNLPSGIYMIRLVSMKTVNHARVILN